MTTTPQPTDGAIAQALADGAAALDILGRKDTAAQLMRAHEQFTARPAQLGGGVVSDAMVEIARAARMEKLHELGRDGTTTSERANRESMRAALEAALGKGGA